ncbi:MAG: DUF4011 domain-containing protein [Mycoplasma sp.]|nr:DUF4011 domain-containing protein [Mycoplasma sp.]
MKKAIKQKLLNLVTIDPKDYCIKTHLDAKHIDILNYVKKDVFLAFINKEVSQMEISAASGTAHFEDELMKANNYDEFVNIIFEYGFDINESIEKNLKKDFESYKKKASVHFINEMKSSKKTFISLNRNAKQYYNDTSRWPLHIAYQFIKGKLNSDVVIKAPLVIQKVEIVEEGSKLFLRRIEDEIIINEKVLVVLNKEYPNNISSDELFKPIPLEETVKRFESMVNYEIPIIKGVEYFINEDNKELLEKYATLKIEPSVVLGFFEPGGSALKQDLEKMIEMNIDPFDSQIDGGKNSSNEFKSNKYYEDKVIKNPDILELNHPLNIFQKYAVASSLQQSTLIYGPPGTGKSEVISNIISNALIKGKNVLMVSEKKAALDVIINRIKTLNQFTLYLCDNRKREDFYKKIDSLNSLLGTQWYREPSRYSRNAQIEPLKLESSELMFFNNYLDWYKELMRLVNKHWDIEDYDDKIFGLDYQQYQNIKNELGEQIYTEWLVSIIIEGTNESTTLYEKVQEIMNNYNIVKIEDFFNEYLKYKKFIKKFKFEETLSPGDITKQIKKVKQKITTNIKLVENFLLGGKKLVSIFEGYSQFVEKYSNLPEFIDFNEKTQKQKEAFLDTIDDFQIFSKKLFSRKPEWKEITKRELVSKVNKYSKFSDKYKKEISKFNWYKFLDDNFKKIDKFLEIFNSVKEDNSKAEIIFAEFVVNNKVIDDINQCELPIKSIKDNSKNMNEIIEMFVDYISNEDVLEHEFVEDLIKFKDFIKYDEGFLTDLYNIREFFTPLNISMYKEFSWLSLPYVKTLYLENFVLFNLKEVGAIMQHISSPITDEQFKKIKIIALWNDIVKNNPMFLELKGINLQDIITQLRREEIRSASIVEELIFKKYINSLRNYLMKLSKEEKDEVANVLRIASSGTLPPINQFVRKYYSSLKKLFPVWVANPDNVADMIPLNAEEFYYGIFDEASQMAIERSYPLVYRTKIKVVSGDDKQLKPTSFFANKLSNEDYDLDDFDSAESLLERAKVSWWNEFHLKNHYRSKSKELIEFSNKFIYNNNLEVATKCGVVDKGIEVINVRGTWNQVNKEEAEKIIEILNSRYSDYEKILIVTFNSRQSQLIENMLIEKNSTFDEALREKIEKNFVVITNLENVQGNEGDLVILSVSYGRNSDGVVRNNFGPLNSKGGSNRLNVAITRAKSKMIIIKSLYGNEIKVSNANNKNAIIFKKFIEYLDALDNDQSIEVVNSEMENVDSINEGTLEITITEQKIKDENALEFTSEIVKSIYADLIKNLSSRYEIKVDFKVGSKNIDLLIVNRKKQTIVKALLVDQWKTNRTIKEMIEEVDRQYFLEDRGYSTFKINEYEWHLDKARVIEKIKLSLTNDQSSNIDYIIWQSEK